MPYNHFIEVGGMDYQFAYHIEDENPPVMRYGFGQTPITYIPTYFASGVDPML